MMPPDNKPSFLDRGTIVALLIAMAFWISWSTYMDKKYPKPPPGQPVATSEAPATVVEQTAPPAATEGGTAAAKASPSAAPPTQEILVPFEHENIAFQVSSRGMGLKNIDIRTFSTRSNEPIILGDVSDRYPFATALAGDDSRIEFAIERSGNTFTGRATVSGMNIQKKMTIDPVNYSIETDLQVTGAGADFKGFTTYISDAIEENAGGGGFLAFLTPAIDMQDFVYVHEGTREQQIILPEKGALEAGEKNVSLVALSSHYFTIALVDRSQNLPRFETKIPAENPETPQKESPVAIGKLVHAPVSPVSDFAVKYVAYAGPKSLNRLTAVNEELKTVINYGMFSWIAIPLLQLLKFLYSFFHNYGMAIIVLTIIVRVIVMPFNLYSFKSMKAMQKIQPEMQRLKEKYKNDPQQMNREVMDLMKRHNANPLGGCLPMLLQLPVFLALYQVLGQSIELYRAPFMFWIQDLSVHDKFYVLPALMTATMWVQQKITPTTMDPQQAKILQWMPLFFGLLMVSLPSGLTLYIFISTLFGIIQQYLFMREKTPNTKISQVQA